MRALALPITQVVLTQTRWRDDVAANGSSAWVPSLRSDVGHRLSVPGSDCRPLFGQVRADLRLGDNDHRSWVRLSAPSGVATTSEPHSPRFRDTVAASALDALYVPGDSDRDDRQRKLLDNLNQSTEVL